jgi:signal transduction histidine kinase
LVNESDRPGALRESAIQELTQSGEWSDLTIEEREGATATPQRRRTIRHLSRNIGAERMIALGRIAIAGYSLLAVYLDPPPPHPFGSLTYFLLYAYAAYALLRAPIVWRSPVSTRSWQIARHVVDLLVFSAFSLLTQGANSPFFLGLLFVMVCATLLFDTAGTIWTSVAALAIYVAIPIVARQISPVEFTLHRFILRTGFLTVIAALIVQLKRHEERLLRDHWNLASWPRNTPGNLKFMLTEILQHAATLLRAPRVIVAWEDRDDAVLNVASRHLGEVVLVQEPISAYYPLIDPAAKLKSFALGSSLHGPVGRSEGIDETVLHLRSNPMHPEFQQHFGISRVVASAFDGEYVSGWIFAVDTADLTADDFLLAEIVAALVESRLEHFYLSEHQKKSAVSEERLRFSRDLHDGILQSLSGTAYELEHLRPLLQSDPAAALASLDKLQEALAGDQREVRSLVTWLRSMEISKDAPLLSVRFDALCDRVHREWGIDVAMNISPRVQLIDPAMTDEVYRVVREAVINAATHSGASRIKLEIIVRDTVAHIIVDDNGHGFGFTGRYDFATLIRIKRGPVSLKGRIRALAGDLVIESRLSGARLEIELPISLTENVS